MRTFGKERADPWLAEAMPLEPTAMSIFCRIDDKIVPLYRVLWVSATPHYCGEAECQCEGLHEVALEGGESLWAKFDEKERLLQMIEEWQAGM
jgi:hypothetical protein